ncbi:hypothetical protein FXO38_14193 [Capsicum annuum]|nr:hypothetical protein FXO38_14193 [Capsicum annuum]
MQALVDPLDVEINFSRENNLCPSNASTYNLTKVPLPSDKSIHTLVDPCESQGESTLICKLPTTGDGVQNDQSGDDDLDLLECLENSSCDCPCENGFNYGPLAFRDGYICEDYSSEREGEGMLNFEDGTLGESETGQDLSPWLRLSFNPGKVIVEMLNLLPNLQKAFSLLSDAQTNSIPQAKVGTFVELMDYPFPFLRSRVQAGKQHLTEMQADICHGNNPVTSSGKGKNITNHFSAFEIGSTSTIFTEQLDVRLPRQIAPTIQDMSSITKKGDLFCANNLAATSGCDKERNVVGNFTIFETSSYSLKCSSNLILETIHIILTELITH